MYNFQLNILICIFYHYICAKAPLFVGLLEKGISPMHYTLNNNSINLPNFDTCNGNGHIDSIRDLLFHDTFIKPYSSQHLLVYTLTKAF